jgi:hypothetical protein
MNLLLDSFWRASMYCLHPRVIALSMLPLLLIVAASFGLGYLFWDPALVWVRESLESFSLLNTLWAWLDSFGLGSMKTVAAPLIVLFAATPLIVVTCLVGVAVLMTPAMVSLVAERRFPALERKRGATLWMSMFWSLGSILLAMVVMLASIPLWLVPPLIVVLPPLIWGWLTYRVLAFDVLAEHASVAERRELMRRHRGWLLGMGLVSGYMGAAPSLVWASSVIFAAAFVLLAPIAIWIYTLVFTFSSLWFAHYCLAALVALRAENAPQTALTPTLSPAGEREQIAGPAQPL